MGTALSVALLVLFTVACVTSDSMHDSAKAKCSVIYLIWGIVILIGVVF